MEAIKNILVAWKERGTPKDLIKRDITIPTAQKKTNQIHTIAGVRQSGKTYTMYQLINQLISDGTDKNSIFYLNFEDERLPEKTETLTELVPTIRQFFDPPKKIYLFLDEIQVIPLWDKWARRIHDDREITLYLSGSSSKLSSKEISTTLRGRAITHDTYPLSFREFLKFKNMAFNKKTINYSEKDKAKLLKLLHEYLKYGGMPEVVLQKDDKIQLLQEYFKTIINRDIIDRYNIRNTSLLTDYLKLLINSTYSSISKSCNILETFGYSLSKNTLCEYQSYAQNSFFIFPVSIISSKIKTQIQYPKKIYCIDNGFLSAISFKYTKAYGRLTENAVFIELKRRNKEIYYWKSNVGDEVDFVIKDNLNITELIQVCWNPAEDVKKREIRGLTKAMSEFHLDKGIIITGDYESEEEINGKKISYIPVWKWLLDI